MDHIAIDLGGRESQVCVRDATGALVEEKRVKTAELGTYLSRRAAGRVVLETCAEAFVVADQALAHGHQVRVVPATLVRSLGVGARGIKTDRRDAQVLSEVSCRIELPSVHLPSEQARKRKCLLGTREALVKSRTLLINALKGQLRAQGRPVRPTAAEAVTKEVRRTLDNQVPAALARLLESIDQLSVQIKEADQEVKAEVKQDAVCQRLMTVPGVGPVVALRFVAALDRVDRFGSAHAVQSYLGLVPGENSSSGRKQRTGITKAGSPQVRWALVQAAWVARIWYPNDPLVQWANQVEQRRGKKVATMALARKLAGVLYALWRDQSTYQLRVGQAGPQPASGATPGPCPDPVPPPPGRRGRRRVSERTGASGEPTAQGACR